MAQERNLARQLIVDLNSVEHGVAVRVHACQQRCVPDAQGVPRHLPRDTSLVQRRPEFEQVLPNTHADPHARWSHRPTRSSADPRTYLGCTNRTDRCSHAFEFSEQSAAYCSASSRVACRTPDSRDPSPDLGVPPLPRTRKALARHSAAPRRPTCSRERLAELHPSSPLAEHRSRGHLYALTSPSPGVGSAYGGSRPSRQVRGRDGFHRRVGEVLGSRPRLPAHREPHRGSLDVRVAGRSHGCLR